MTRVALAGLLGRKLRTALTAILANPGPTGIARERHPHAFAEPAQRNLFEQRQIGQIDSRVPKVGECPGSGAKGEGWRIDRDIAIGLVHALIVAPHA